MPVPEGDDELVGVTEALAVDDVESVPVSLPVADGLAPRVTDAVGVRETERERLSVLDGVMDGVGVPDGVPVPVDVLLDDIVDVPDGVAVVDGVSDALAPRETEEVCDGDCVAVRVVVVV